MSAEVRWTGLHELIQTLTNAPGELREEGFEIVREAANQASREIVAAYPVGPSGNLRARVRVETLESTLLIAKVISAAPHSHLYEFGTTERKTDSGASRGRMPKAPVTPDVAQKWRVWMYEQLKALVERKGFSLSET